MTRTDMHAPKEGYIVSPARRDVNPWKSPICRITLISKIRIIPRI
ncbi:MAG: hypothetical protein WC455_27490 [Dehalococcoidia bacterium]